MKKIAIRFSFLIIFIFSCSLCNGQAVSESPRKQKVIVVVGAAGMPEYGREFQKWAQVWQQNCEEGDAECVIIGLDDVGDSNDLKVLEDILSEEAVETNIPLWLVLIGHGTYDGREAKFNLRGPDLSNKILAEWLQPISRPLVIINSSSSSAPFLPELSAANRIIITATRSGFELNYSRFGQYFADAIAEPQADIDKDGQTSLLEAFLIASNNVAEFYSDNGRLATEHPLLDDNGDGYGTSADWFRGIRPVQQAANDTGPDGYTAHQFCLIKSEEESKIPLELLAERNRLELEVIKLRDTKEELSEQEYFDRLEQLLYEIAIIYEQSDNR